MGVEIWEGTGLVWFKSNKSFFVGQQCGQKVGQFCCNRHSWPLNMNKNVGVLAKASASAILSSKWEVKLFMDKKVL